ncbi:N(1)-aminopropylagmatine ureohydrolase [uncultured archaeon]|nr:N(1)-aminopropylagmatine ureohydrolase [uncultured archaeon]
MQIISVKLINSPDGKKGCEKSPVEILKSLKEIEINEKGKIVEFDKLNLSEIHVNSDNIEEANHLIFENSKEAFGRNFKSFFLGGDHSISFSIARAFKKIELDPLLIIFDAHLDCKESGKSPDSIGWLRKLVEGGWFNPEKIVLIGVRRYLKEELDFLKENRITLIKMDVLQFEIDGVCDIVMERARKSTGFYVSIDMDCVDPAYAPGVSNPETGGISSRDLIYFIKRLVLLNNFRGADIVEINSLKDINGMTVKLGAKLLSEMI